MPSSRGSSRLRDRTWVSWGSCIAGGFFTTEPPGKHSRFSHVSLFETLWTVTHQALLSMGFSRSGLPLSSPEDLPNLGTEPESPHCRHYPLVVWVTSPIAAKLLLGGIRLDSKFYDFKYCIYSLKPECFHHSLSPMPKKLMWVSWLTPNVSLKFWASRSRCQILGLVSWKVVVKIELFVFLFFM